MAGQPTLARRHEGGEVTDVRGDGRPAEFLHLYGVVGAVGQRGWRPPGLSVAPGPIGPDSRPASRLGDEVFSVSHRDLAAIVGPTPVRAYRSMKKEDVLPYLFAHQAVLEKILEERSVVPVKFGTTARDREEVHRLLAAGYPQFRAALDAVEGKIELDVVALWSDLDALLRELGEAEEIRRARPDAIGRSAGETREALLRIGKMLKAGLDLRREAVATEIVEALRGSATDLCPHALMNDRMILNTALLVERSRAGEVGRSLDRLNGRYAERVNFRCVGPLPPYSFRTVEIRCFTAEEIERARGLLGVEEKAGASGAKAAYRRLAHECHPDTGPGGPPTDERFQQVTEAYRVLTDYYAAAESVRPGDAATEVAAIRLLRWNGETDGA